MYSSRNLAKKKYRINELKMVKLFIKKLFFQYPRIDLKKQYNVERLGSDYGGWNINPDIIPNKNALVYSFGVGEDITFDLSLIKKYNTEVYAFDPTPKSIEWIKKQHLPQKFNFYEIGIANYNGTAKFRFPKHQKHVSFRIDNRTTDDQYVNCNVKTLKKIMEEFGHSHIDILKMDIEGAEYEVLQDMIESKIYPDQLLVEFHFRNDRKKVKNTEETIKKLERENYQIFSISNSGNEVSLLRVKK